MPFNVNTVDSIIFVSTVMFSASISQSSNINDFLVNTEAAGQVEVFMEKFGEFSPYFT